MASSDNNKVVQAIVAILVLAGACAYLLTNGPSGINLVGWLDERRDVLNAVSYTHLVQE